MGRSAAVGATGTGPAEVEAAAAVRAGAEGAEGGTDDEPLKHLGEAETCFVIKEWATFAGSWWISDDREALRYARFQGIATYETFDLMRIAVADGDIADKQAFDLMHRMAATGRSLRLPSSVAELRR